MSLRFIADENIPLRVVRLLRENDRIDIKHITEVAGKGLKDSEIAELSAKEERIIITFDKDFGSIIARSGNSNEGIVHACATPPPPIKPYGVVILRIKPRSLHYIYSIMVRVLSMELEFEHKLIIVKEDRIRVLPF